jgi:hypothetical protein
VNGNDDWFYLFIRKYFKYSTEKEDDTDDEDNSEEVIPLPKYDDKYLKEYKRLGNELEFTDEELDLEKQKTTEFQSTLELNLFNQITDLEKQLSELNQEIDDISCLVISEECREDLLSEKRKSIATITGNLNDLMETTIEENQAPKMAREYIVNEKLNKLKNSIVIEKTPVGNVIMFYNNERSSFEYYSDSTVPYRYLEVIGRKYVITFKCKQIFVDLELELEDAERRLKERKDKEKGLAEQMEKDERNNVKDVKKTVFAKFKSYNNENSVHSKSVPASKTSSQNGKKQVNDDNCILKEKSNRYSCEGKLVNFSFLKKVDRKVVDKRFAISFADYKKQQLAQITTNPK